MTRSATHGSFTIERHYKASPARVFRAFTDPKAKEIWFTGGESWTQTLHEDDFRVDGHERMVGTWKDGTVTDYRSRYEEIVPDARIVNAYRMYLNDVLISVSLATVEFHADGEGTKLLFTEQLTCLDEYTDPDAKDREGGVGSHLDRLATYLEREPALH